MTEGGRRDHFRARSSQVRTTSWGFEARHSTTEGAGLQSAPLRLLSSPGRHVCWAKGRG